MLVPTQRIVSLLPSATEIVCALGLAERLVGISHSCDYPPSVTDRPRLTRPRSNLDGLSSGEIDAAVRAALRDHGSVYEIDVAGIRALGPDLVLTQGICDVCAVPESQVVSSLGPTLKSGNSTTQSCAASRPPPMCTCSMRRHTSAARVRAWSTVWKSSRRLYSLRESCFDTRCRPADLPLQRDVQGRAARNARLRGAERDRERRAPTS